MRTVGACGTVFLEKRLKESFAPERKGEESREEQGSKKYSQREIDSIVRDYADGTDYTLRQPVPCPRVHEGSQPRNIMPSPL